MKGAERIFAVMLPHLDINASTGNLEACLEAVACRVENVSTSLSAFWVLLPSIKKERQQADTSQVSITRISPLISTFRIKYLNAVFTSDAAVRVLVFPCE